MPLPAFAWALLVALGASGSPVEATAANQVVPPPQPSTATAAVTGMRIVSNAGRADVVISVEHAVTLEHFVITKPYEIVVDLGGAALDPGLAADAYDGVVRGGVTQIRYSQLSTSLVRVVVTLDAPYGFDLTQQEGEIRVSIDGPGATFEPWQLGSRKSGASNGDARRVTVSWENAPIADVVGMFAAFTGRTILPSRNVTGTVTASIVDLPWDEALREVMNANGYDVAVHADGVIVVDTFESILARQATIPLGTRTLRLNYARAVAVRDMVRERLTRTCPTNAAIPSALGVAQPPPIAGQPVQSGPTMSVVQSLACPQRGTVTADTITNSISITDVPVALADLEEYARSLDLRPPQVHIMAKIILVDRSTLEGLGLRYDLGTSQQFFNDIVPRLDPTGAPLTTPAQVVLGGNLVSAIANATARIPSAALQLVYSTALGHFDLTAFLEALKTNTLLDVQAEPSASVLNNRTANLTAGTQVPIRVIDAGAGGNQTTTFPRANVAFQQTGVILAVTPQITANHQIQMRVHVENSDVQFEANDVGAVFPKQSVDNEVLVADGETAVMGGLTQSTITRSRTGIPLLVDLPVIGRLFGVTNRTAVKRDLLILITPHIIDEGEAPRGG